MVSTAVLLLLLFLFSYWLLWLEAWNYDTNNSNCVDRSLRHGTRYLIKSWKITSNIHYLLKYLFGTNVNIKIGGALRCHRCSSEFDSACGDKFQNSTRQFMVDCSAERVYDLTPIDSCRKTMYKGKIPRKFRIRYNFSQWEIANFIIFFFIHIAKDKMIIIRDCNVKDNKKLDNAKVFTCNTDGCNSADNHHSFIVFPALAAFYAFAKYL